MKNMKTKTEQKADTKGGEKKPRERRERPISFPMYPWVLLQGNMEGVKGDQIIVYHWLFWRNSLAKLQGGVAYGKVTYQTLYAEITSQLGIGRPDNICSELQKKGWIKKTHCKPFEGHKTYGYLCMKDNTAMVDATYEQQALQLEEELPENAKVVESSAQGDADMGERYQFGLRFYYDEQGEMVRVPMAAPARPTRTAVWVNDPEGWFEPEEIPERESEF